MANKCDKIEALYLSIKENKKTKIIYSFSAIIRGISVVTFGPGQVLNRS